MKITSALDIKLFVVTIVTVVCIVLIFGDAMFIGLWYYLAVPGVAALICWPFKPRPLFRFGVALALSLTFIAYLSINYASARPEGLLGLGHTFSLPGAALGLIVSVCLSRKVSNLSVLGSFLYGFVGPLSGFFINQLAVCNTIMW